MPVPSLKEVREYLRQRAVWEAKAEATHWQDVEILKSRPKPEWIEMKKLYPAAFAYLEAEEVAHCGTDYYEPFGRAAMEAIANGENPEEAIARMKKQQTEYLFSGKLFGDEK